MERGPVIGGQAKSQLCMVVYCTKTNRLQKEGGNYALPPFHDKQTTHLCYNMLSQYIHAFWQSQA